MQTIDYRSPERSTLQTESSFTLAGPRPSNIPSSYRASRLRGRPARDRNRVSAAVLRDPSKKRHDLTARLSSLIEQATSG